MDNNLTGRPVEILLVEDNPGDVLLTQEALKDARINNRLFVAKDGEIAMKMLRRGSEYMDGVRPDLIFLDLNMPKKDGRSVLREIKQDDDLKDIPVIVMTSSQAEADVARTYSLNASGYLVKPLSLDGFMKVIRSLENFCFTVMISPKSPD